MSERPIYGFMHIACMNHWDEVVRRQIWKIRESGLLDATKRVFWGMLGDPETLIFDPIFMSKSEIAFRDSNLALYEFPTLGLVEEICKREDCIVWYIHTKGVSYSPPKQDAEIWREYMEYFVLDHWGSASSRSRPERTPPARSGARGVATSPATSGGRRRNTFGSSCR
jgi:hypothetical protein